MSNDYKIEVGDTLVIYSEEDKDADMCMLKVEYIDEWLTGVVISGKLTVDNDKDYYVLDKYKGKTKVAGIGDVSRNHDEQLITINITGETEYPSDVVTTDNLYMIYSCPTQNDINDFLTESGSKLTHVPEGDSIYGLFFALFKEQDRRIQELEKALIESTNANTSH